MKKRASRLVLCAFVLFCGALLTVGGCDVSGISTNEDYTPRIVQLSEFGPSKIEVAGLTRFDEIDDYRKYARLKVFVDVYDKYDTRIKSPGLFRFELYEYRPRSGDPKGKRVHFWADMDLFEPRMNNALWSDSFRSYEFNLEMQGKLSKEKSYILLVTMVTSDGERLSGEGKLRYGSK